MSSLKVCTKCKAEKPLTAFSKRKDNSSGYRTTCKECDYANRRKWYQETIEVRREKQVIYDARSYEKNRDKILERCRNYSKNNRTKKTEYVREWNRRNPEKVAASNLRHRETQYEWRREHPEVFNAHAAKRRAAKLNATPPWVDKQHLDTIAELYKTDQALSAYYGEQFDVDHIEPLRGRNSSGLGVWWNLRVIPHSENVKKNNKLILNYNNNLN